MRAFIELASNLVQTFTIAWFLTKFFGCKYEGLKGKIGFIAVWIIAFLQISFLNLIVMFEGFLAVITIATFMLYANLFLKGPWKFHIFLTIFAFSIIFTASSLFLFVGVFLAGTSLSDFALNMSGLRLLLLIVLRISEYLIFKFVLRVNSQYSLTAKEWMLFIAIPLATWSMMTTLTGATVVSEIVLPYIFRASILMVLINVIIYFFMLKIKKDSETRLNYKLLQLQYNNIRNIEVNIKAMYENTRSLKHDLDKHLFAVKEMAKKQNCDDITDYIEKITQTANTSMHKVVFSDNDIFNAVVNARLALCKNEGITVNIEIDKVAVSFLSTEMSVVVIGNILDNAIEAAKNARDKRLNFFIKLKREYISIFVENTFDGNYSDSNLKTTKKDSQSHGFGIKNVKQAVESNGGMSDFYIGKNGMFCCDILLKKQ